MIYDGLFAIDLPARPGTPQPVSGFEGLDRLLFTGRARIVHAECSLSAAAVLARCHELLRGLGAATLAVHDDGDELLSLQVAKEPGAPAPHWPALLPTAWSETPCSFRLRARLADEETVAVVHLRYVPRHPVEVGGLTGAVRVLARSGTASLPVPRLARALRRRGRDLAGQLVADLRAAFDHCHGSLHGRVVVPWGRADHPDRFGALLAGFTTADLAGLEPAECRLETSRRAFPAVDPDGLPGRVRAGEFTPTEEHTDAT